MCQSRGSVRDLGHPDQPSGKALRVLTDVGSAQQFASTYNDGVTRQNDVLSVSGFSFLRVFGLKESVGQPRAVGTTETPGGSATRPAMGGQAAALHPGREPGSCLDAEFPVSAFGSWDRLQVEGRGSPRL